MAHTNQDRWSGLVDAKLRTTLVTRDNLIFNTRYEGSPKAGKVKIPVRDTEVEVKAYSKSAGIDPAAGTTTYLDLTIDQDEAVNELIDGFDAASLNRLHDLIASKRTLLQKALGVEPLPVQVTEDRVSFPWFHGEIDADHAQAYMHLIVQLCAMAKNSKRITAKDKETDNEKYAFRCFLLRLGFIGDGFKRYRKILLEKLEGSSAFRNGAPKPGRRPSSQTSPTTGAETEVSA